MANKISNEHLKIVLTKSKRFRTLDTLIVMVDLAKQITINNLKENSIFIIPSHNSAYSLWNEIDRKYKGIINSTTLRECLKELMELKIVEYNEEYDGFELMNMKKMIEKKGVGYTNIRSLFFEKTFLQMPFSSKKIFLYFLSLLDNKKSSKIFKNKYKSDIFVNLNKYKKKFNKEELNIMNIFQTENVYYVKEVLDKTLLMYPDLFISNTKKLRLDNYGKEKGKIQGVCTDLTYFFDINNDIKNNSYNLEKEYNILSNRYKTLSEKINTISKSKGINLSQIIKISLIRKLYRYLPFAQDSVINTVVNRISKSFSGYKAILNINAFIQFLINEKFEYRNAFSYRLPFERGWKDNII